VVVHTCISSTWQLEKDGLHSEFEVSLDYIARPCPKQKTKTKKKEYSSYVIQRFSYIGWCKTSEG
jgi:hypothetical protein